MRKTPVIGVRGLSGWRTEPDDLDAYLADYASAAQTWARIWAIFRPVITDNKISYTRPDGGLSIVTPDTTFFMLLRRGGVIRHMRVIDEWGARRVPVFDGTGEIMPSMTEDEALDFLIWKDVPRGTNHVVIVSTTLVPADRVRRNQWQLSESGAISN